MINRKVLPGDVFQVIEDHARPGWRHCLIMTEEVHSWGVVGFIKVPDSDNTWRTYFVRMPFSQLAFVGCGRLEPAVFGDPPEWFTKGGAA